jgi:S-formylglutathione hydrolase
MAQNLLDARPDWRRENSGLLLILLVGALLSLSTPTQSQENPKAGTVERITVHGDSLVGNLAGDSPDRLVSVYLPGSYATSPKRRYPVLYLLHGFTDTDDRWFGLSGPHFVNVPAAANKAFAGGSREFMIVMPNAYTRYQGSMYSSSVVTGDWEAFVARDLVSYIDAHYRTLARRTSRGLAGHSMGGYGTLRIGMKYPDVFSSLYSMNPCCLDPLFDPPVLAVELAAKVQTAEDVQAAGFFTKAMLASAAAWSPNPRNPPLYFDLPVKDGHVLQDVIARWVANAPLAMVHQYIPALRKYDAIALDAGDKDLGNITATVRTMDQILKDYGIAHDFEIYEGDHVDRVSQRLETKVLPFFSTHLEFP